MLASMSNEPPPLPPVPPVASSVPPLPQADPHAPVEAHVGQLAAIAEILLGAAYADGKASVSEHSALAAVLTGFFGHKDLPEAVRARIQSFDPKAFDLATALQRLTVKTPDDRVQLLGLVSRVVDADARLAKGEEDYLRKLAGLIGATPEELAPFIAPD